MQALDDERAELQAKIREVVGKLAALAAQETQVAAERDELSREEKQREQGYEEEEKGGGGGGGDRARGGFRQRREADQRVALELEAQAAATRKW